MIATTILYLMIIGLLSLIRSRTRFDRVASVVITVSVMAVFAYFIKGLQQGHDSVLTLLWDSSRSGDIKINIISSSANYLMILPFFIITLIALFNNLFFRYESHKRQFSAVLVLNLVSLMMLIAGNNFVQIITFVFVIDILSQLLVKDIYASRRYTIYNLVADMGLFLVLAMIHGKLENLDVGNIHRYYETGRHRDFIAAVIMFSLFIKFGFFLFQSYLLDLKSARFHRLILIPYLSTPMVSLILFVKFYPLLVVSTLFLPVLFIASALTMIWGAAGVVIINNLKEKAIYLNMMIIALLVVLVENAGFKWNTQFSWLLVSGFLLNCCVYYLHYYANRENNVLMIEKLQKSVLLPLRFVLAVTMMVLAAFAVETAALFRADNAIWILSFALLFILTFSSMFAQIIHSRQNTDFAAAFDYRPLPVLLLAACTAGAIFYQEKNYWYVAAVVLVLFAALVAVNPLRRGLTDKKINDRLQSADAFSRFYQFLIDGTLKYSGKILNVLIDFVFIEKTVISAVGWFDNFIIRLFRRLNRLGLSRFIFAVLTAGLVFSWCFWENRP